MTERTLFISGYPYARDAYRRTFDFAPENEMAVRFILPRSWPIKGGEIIFRPKQDDRTVLVPAWFSHSHYPLIGGLLKGLMPTMPFVLFKYAKKGDVLFTALEPTLLSALYNGLWAKLRGMSHVLFTWENIPYERKHGKLGLFFKRTILTLNRWFSDGIVCGNPEADVIMAELGFKRRAVVPLSGIDTERFSPRPRPRVYRSIAIEGMTTISYAGALDDRKGLPYLLDAFERLISAKHAVHLFVAGAGSMRDEIEARIQEPVLKGRVTLLPWLSPGELSELLSATDVFVYPSTTRGGWAEQFGYVVAEALASGTPAIVSTSGALPWVIKDGETDLVVPERDAQALQKAIEQLLNDPILRRRLGEAGMNDATKRFGYRAVASGYASFFRSLI